MRDVEITVNLRWQCHCCPHAMKRPARERSYVLNGFTSGTPKDLKSTTFLVATVKP